MATLRELVASMARATLRSGDVGSGSDISRELPDDTRTNMCTDTGIAAKDMKDATLSLDPALEVTPEELAAYRTIATTRLAQHYPDLIDDMTVEEDGPRGSGSMTETQGKGSETTPLNPTSHPTLTTSTVSCLSSSSRSSYSDEVITALAEHYPSLTRDVLEAVFVSQEGRLDLSLRYLELEGYQPVGRDAVTTFAALLARAPRSETGTLTHGAELTTTTTYATEKGDKDASEWIAVAKKKKPPHAHSFSHPTSSPYVYRAGDEYRSHKYGPMGRGGGAAGPVLGGGIRGAGGTYMAKKQEAVQDIYRKCRVEHDKHHTEVVRLQGIIRARKEGRPLGSRDQNMPLPTLKAALSAAIRAREEAKIKASKSTFRVANMEESVIKVDLHGLSVEAALHQLGGPLRALWHLARGGSAVVLEVVVGKGIHSEGGVPRLRPNVMLHLDSIPYVEYEVDVFNAGLLYVRYREDDANGP